MNNLGKAILLDSLAHAEHVGEEVTLIRTFKSDAYEVEFSDGSTGIALRTQLGECKARNTKERR